MLETGQIKHCRDFTVFGRNIASVINYPYVFLLDSIYFYYFRGTYHFKFLFIIYAVLIILKPRIGYFKKLYTSAFSTAHWI